MLWRVIGVGALLFSLSVCLVHGAILKPPDTGGPPSCSQEMCVFLFDRLEEQSVRLHNLEAVLLRTVSILTSTDGQNLSTAIATLKGDPLINSLSASMDYDPVESFVLHPVPLSSNVEVHEQPTGRRKREAEVQLMNPKERLIEALKWSKKNRDVRTVDQTESRSVQASGGETSIELKQETQRYSRASINLASKENSNEELSKKSIELLMAPVDVLNITVDNEKAAEALPVANTTFTNATFLETQNSSTTPFLCEFVSSPGFTNVPLPTNYTKNATEEHLASHKYVKDTVGDLQGALKCAMGQLNDASASETLGILHDPQATLNPNKTLTVQFELKNCFKYWVGVWIRVSVRPEFMDLGNETGIETTKNQIVVQIPKQCWKRKGNVYSLTLPSNSRAPCSLHSHCSFPFMIKLKECKIYSVDFIPIYLTLQGQPTFANITVPPQAGGNSTDLSKLEQVLLSNSTHALNLKWSTHSNDCAKLMTSVNVNIYRDGSDSILRAFTIPFGCLKNHSTNSFSALLSSPNLYQSTCPSVTWQPLDICRKYKLDLEPEYSSTWKGKSSSLEIFTPGVSQTSCCHVLTDSSGTLQSYNNNEGNNGCAWLISVKKNHTIYLTFSQFYLANIYRLKIYDGPYTDSSLLLSQSGNPMPMNPIRSSGNQLFIELENDQSYYEYRGHSKTFTANYITVCNNQAP